MNTTLYHIESTRWCLSAIFLKDDMKINKHCKLAVTNITGPEANYLNQGNWAISLEKPTQMEIKCTTHTHVKTFQPPLAFITLQSACSGFSSKIKLPPYFRQYSKGFHIALKAANLHIPKFTPTNFRIWTPFNLSNITSCRGRKFEEVRTCPSHFH